MTPSAGPTWPAVPVRQWGLSLPFELRALAAFDADGDFDLDLLITQSHGQSLLWTNDGTGHFNLDIWADSAGPAGALTSPSRSL